MIKLIDDWAITADSMCFMLGQASDTPYSKKLHKIRKEGFLNEY